MEVEFKRRKAAADRARQASPSKGASAAATQEKQDELDLIGGTTEDDFTEAMQNIRERELLYGQQSLLARFGPLVAEICANDVVYKVHHVIPILFPFIINIFRDRTEISKPPQPSALEN